MMRVAIRADASETIGHGHVMRCLCLADKLREGGAKTLFLCTRWRGHLGDLIASRGHDLTWLQECDEFDPTTDAEHTAAALAAVGTWDWLVVDHYALDASWERAQRSAVKKILVIDDLADRAHDCDLLLDQNLQLAGRYEACMLADCHMLIGPRYALLRPQFAATRQTQTSRTGTVRRLLLFFGGTDAGGETLKALAALQLLGRHDFATDVVISESNPLRVAIAAACRDLQRTELHMQVENMAELMAAADLCLGAGGGASWERCCLGLPALVVATADNQIEQVERLAEAGALGYLGPAEAVDAKSWARSLACILDMPHGLIHMARQAADLVDGRGVERVANDLLADRLSLRRALPGDSAALHAWRNHPDTRCQSFDPAEIDQVTHERWLAQVQADPDRELLIAETSDPTGSAIGVLRFDIEAGRALVSIYLVPGLAGQGWGVRLLLAGENWLRRQRTDVRVLEAEVAAGNLASTRAFQAAGFLPSQSRFKKDIHGNH